MRKRLIPKSFPISFICSLAFGCSIATASDATTSNLNSKQNKIAPTTEQKSIDLAMLNGMASLDLTPDLNPQNPLKLKNTAFFQIVHQNSPVYSTANNDLCIKDIICFSSHSDIGLRYYDRAGNYATYSETGSLWGVGTRPLYGPAQGSLYGSIDDANIYIDLRINQLISGSMSIAYVNGSSQSKTYNDLRPDWASVYNSGAALKLDETYFTMADPSHLPFYLKLGRMYSNFGDYKVYPMTQSLTQLLTQYRTGAAEGGFVLKNGLYGSVSWSMAQMTLNEITPPVNTLRYDKGDRSRNFAGKLGFQDAIPDYNTHFNINMSAIKDIRDVDYLNEFYTYLWDTNTEVGYNTQYSGTQYYMQHAPALAFHGDVKVGRYGFMAEFVKATHTLNPNSNVPMGGRIYAWTLDANIDFDTPFFFGLEFPSNFDLGYQRGNNSDVMMALPGGPGKVALQQGPILPQYRHMATYTAQIMKNFSIGAQWVQDRDNSQSNRGTGRTANMGVLRATIEV